MTVLAFVVAVMMMIMIMMIVVVAVVLEVVVICCLVVWGESICWHASKFVALKEKHVFVVTVALVLNLA